MATNAQTALTNRQYYMIHGNWGSAPKWFAHTPPSGRPDMPSTINTLVAPEQTVLRKLIDAREEGNFVSGGLPFPVPGVVNAAELVTTAGKAAWAEIEAYYERPDVIQWVNKNKVSREAQWKLFNADVHDEAERSGVVPASGTTSGTGANSTGPGTPPAP